MSSSVKFNVLSFKITLIISFHLRSAHDKVIKALENQAALPLLKIQIIFFQYAGVPLMEYMKLNAFSWAVNFCAVALIFTQHSCI